jgi:hypothetical protein
MNRAMAAVAMVLAAASPAVAGDPPTPEQEVQIVQSALDLLGHDPGPIDGVWGARTTEAAAAFAAASGYAGPTDRPDGALIEALLAQTGPAVEARFGTDPTGTWDLDFDGMHAAEREELMAIYGLDSVATCSSPFAIYFSGGIVYRQHELGVPVVMEVRDGEMRSLDPGGEFEPFVFAFVDDLTLRRDVEGMTEYWARCEAFGGPPL